MAGVLITVKLISTATLLKTGYTTKPVISIDYKPAAGVQSYKNWTYYNSSDIVATITVDEYNFKNSADQNYNIADVIKSVIESIREYFDVNKHEMGDNIFLGDLEKEITLLDGVVSLINLRVYKIWNGTYSPDKCPLPPLVESDSCSTPQGEAFNTPDGSESEQIDLLAIDKVLYGDYNSMFEIKNPNFDIQCRAKTI